VRHEEASDCGTDPVHVPKQMFHRLTPGIVETFALMIQWIARHEKDTSTQHSTRRERISKAFVVDTAEP
jgi:hypothetical protein